MKIKKVVLVNQGLCSNHVMFECGCECYTDGTGHVTKGSSCGDCIENMTFGELKALMQKAITEWRIS